jgi:hypothetical protein
LSHFAIEKVRIIALHKNEMKKRKEKPSAKTWCFAGYIVDSKNPLKKDLKPKLWNVAFIIGQAPGKSKRCSTSYKMDIHSSLVNGYIKLEI